MKLQLMGQQCSAEHVAEQLAQSTIFDKIEFSGITRASMAAKIKDLNERQVPNRDVLLGATDEEVAEMWFKNWLHPNLKHAVIMPQPTKYYIRSTLNKTLRDLDAKFRSMHFYENGQQNFTYTLADIVNYIEQAPDSKDIT
jgi:ribosomal protein L31